MASIVISDLRPVGSEFFMGSESFMTDLVEGELGDINGGITPAITTSSGVCIRTATFIITAITVAVFA